MLKTMKSQNGCTVVNVFKSKEETERKESVQAGLVNLICRAESTPTIKYIRVR